MDKQPDIKGTGMTSQRTRNRLTTRLRERGISSEILLDIIGQTPRHIFIDEALSHRAYEDTALPIGFGQTISQPYTVARMTELMLAAGPLRTVLEIGTGCGYQTSILAQLVDKVYTVERIQGLVDRAKENLKVLGLRNVQFKYDDGNYGWPERGPFDGIIVTASARHIPAELVQQLKPGGRIIIPVGTAEAQQLMLVQLQDDGVQTTVLEEVRFVPLMGGKS